MAKIFVTSDPQLGRQFIGLGKSGDLVRKAIKSAFEKSIGSALETSVDMFLVSGNLFATNLVSRNLIDFVFRQVERLGRIPFVVVPGELDCLDDNSVYRHLPTENRPENLFILGLTPEPALTFPDSEITVYGVPDFGDKLPQAGWQTPPRKVVTGAHVLAIGNRCAVDPNDSKAISPLLQQLILKGSFDFFAVGAYSNYRQWATNAYSAGPPETLGYESEQSGLSLMVEINGDSASVEAVPTGELSWKRLNLEANRFLYNIEIERELHKLSGENNLVEASIIGDFVADGYLDLMNLELGLADNFCFLRIRDERAKTEVDLSAAHENLGSLAAEFTDLMRENIRKAPPELKTKYLEALSTGRALLSGKDVI